MTHSLNFSELVKWHIKTSQFNDPITHLPWSNSICQSVAGLSQFMLKQTELRQYPEIIALAYWFRAANIEQLKQQAKLIQNPNSGLSQQVFHIAPANVDTVFFYSALLSVLSGNKNIVRVSERSGDITWLLVEILKAYLQTPQGELLKSTVAIVQYSALQVEVTAQLSNWCDLRVIWGGDNAINEISQIKPQTPQICFPDRFSIAVIQLTAKTDINPVATAFLTDLVPFNQQACSSPKAIYWFNTDVKHQQFFWQQVGEVLPNMNHQFVMSNKVEQHILLQKLIIGYDVELIEKTGKSFAKLESIANIGRSKVKNLTATALIQHNGNGLILESDITSETQLPAHNKLQTVALSGVTIGNQKIGLRHVELGKALAFDAVWDGVNLLKVF